MRVLRGLFITAIVGAVLSQASAAYDPLKNYRLAADHSLDKQNKIALASGAILYMTARDLDVEARASFAGQRRIGDTDRLGNEVLGTGVPGTLLGAGFWIYGARSENQRALHAGQAQLEALLATAALTTAVKAMSLRERPDQSDRYSFPSGHTSTVSASAMSLYEFYGWKAGVPGLALVGLTAMSRMSANRHWLSDTVGGATLGVLVGHAVARAHLDQLEASSAGTKRGSSVAWALVPTEGGASLNLRVLTSL